MPFLADTLQDARFTLRQLRRNPFFALTVITTLALAIGATAALTGVLRATLLNALPYPQPDSLVLVADRNSKAATPTGFTSVLRTQDLAEAPHLFTSVAYSYADDSSLTLPGHEPLRVPATAVSGAFFSTLGTAPQLGRTLTPADDVMGGPQLLVLSDHLWRTAFAADPAILGRTVRLGPDSATVVGVMPRAFDYPAGTDLWHPSHVLPRNFGGYRGDGSRFVAVFARLAPGVTLLEARAALGTLSRNLAKAYPATDAGWRFDLVGLRTSLFGEYRGALLLLAAAVALVLLIAAVNIAGLQLSQNAARSAEFSIRGALGIDRARLVRQLLTESLLLVLTGSLVGVALAHALLKLLATRLPLALLRVQTPQLDLPTLLFALAVAVVVGLGSAALPALGATRALHPSARTVAGRSRRFGSFFTAAQIALSLALLTVAGSLLTNLYHLLGTPLGFNPAELRTFTVDLPWNTPPATAHRLYAELEERFRAMPGVVAAGSTTIVPLSGRFTLRNTFDIAGQAPTPQHDAVVAEGRSMSPGYLATLQIPLLAGRAFNTAESAGKASDVVLVNQALAHQYFPAGDAVGKRLRAPNGAKGEWTEAEIIGITGDVHGGSSDLAAPVQPEVYYPENGGWPHMQFALRTTLPAAALKPQVDRLVSSLESTASAGHFSSVSANLDRSLLQPRLNAALLTAFAALSLLLVIVGVYGLVAFDVAQRTRELGLRIALGSTRAGVLTLLLGESARVLAGGLVLGFLASYFSARLLHSLLAGPAPQSVALSLVTAVLLGAAVLAATFVPARKASRLDPMEALKTT